MSYDVKFWATDIYRGRKVTTYKVRWFVAHKSFKEPFRTAALAESFRAGLLSAARRGEAFDVETGRPLSMTRAAQDVSWYRFACDYTDMKWPTAAATYRRSISEALTAISCRPDRTRLREASRRANPVRSARMDFQLQPAQ